MNELYGGRFRPTTTTIGFLRCGQERAAEAFLEWQRAIHEDRGVTLRCDRIPGTLEAAFHALLPLTSVERRRFLFLPTSSPWTAFLDNGHQGTDAFPPMSFLAEKLSCPAIRATSSAEAPFPAVVLEIYGPQRGYFLNYVRAIHAARDGDRWSFGATGEVQPFEETERYSERRIRERFTPDMLDRYLRAMGIHMFEEEFYLPHGKPAILIEKVGPSAPATREYAHWGTETECPPSIPLCPPFLIA